jgi:hypothetical protein
MPGAKDYNWYFFQVYFLLLIDFHKSIYFVFVYITSLPSAEILMRIAKKNIKSICDMADKLLFNFVHKEHRKCYFHSFSSCPRNRNSKFTDAKQIEASLLVVYTWLYFCYTYRIQVIAVCK